MRPYVVVNLAMSADGKLSTVERRQVRISGPKDRLRVDALKATSDAIMVGIGTVLADNPSLTVKTEERKQERRASGKDENPIRVVVDSRARTPVDADLLHKGEGKRIIAVSRAADPGKTLGLQEWAEILVCGEHEVDLTCLLKALLDQGVKRLMVEGGGTLIGALFERHLVDELQTFVGNLIIGGSTAPTPADGRGFLREQEFVRLSLVEAVPLDEGVLLRWKVRQDQE
jgi:2,5-diamino-6-(ribosylamino)-4(3H)-pyrimidinone 5'-phosphate reductase